jgi:hypothetical protein
MFQTSGDRFWILQYPGCRFVVPAYRPLAIQTVEETVSRLVFEYALFRRTPYSVLMYHSHTGRR